jgi:hypothetical protein
MCVVVRIVCGVGRIGLVDGDTTASFQLKKSENIERRHECGGMMARCVKSVSDINQDMGLTVRHSGLVIAAGWRAKMNKNRLNGTYLDGSIKKAQSVAVKSGLPAEVDEDDVYMRHAATCRTVGEGTACVIMGVKQRR